MKREVFDHLVDAIREEGRGSGTITLEGSGFQSDTLVVSLARFQSYRTRTIEALWQEVDDFVLETHAKGLRWEVYEDVGLVHLIIY